MEDKRAAREQFEAAVAAFERAVALFEDAYERADALHETDEATRRAARKARMIAGLRRDASRAVIGLHPTEVVEIEGQFYEIRPIEDQALGQLGFPIEIASESNDRNLHEVPDPLATERNNAPPIATAGLPMLSPMPVSEKRRRDVGAAIARMRREQGKGPGEFALDVGINRTTLWKIETGREFPRDGTLGAIATKLGTSPSVLDPGGEDEHGHDRSANHQG